MKRVAAAVALFVLFGGTASGRRTPAPPSTTTTATTTATDTTASATTTAETFTLTRGAQKPGAVVDDPEATSTHTSLAEILSAQWPFLALFVFAGLTGLAIRKTIPEMDDDQELVPAAKPPRTSADDVSPLLQILAGPAQPDDSRTDTERAAERLTQLSIEEQQSACDSVVRAWLQQRSVEVSLAQLPRFALIGQSAAALIEDLEENSATERFLELLNAWKRVSTLDAEMENERELYATKLDEQRRKASEAAEAAKIAETARDDAEQRLTETSVTLEGVRKQLKTSREAERTLSAALETHKTDSKTAVDKLKRQFETTRNDLITQHGLALRDLEKGTETVRQRLDDVTASLESAISLEQLQWGLQKRLAMKVQDPSMSSVFLFAAYLSLFQFLRGVIGKDDLQKNIGLVNFHTLLEKLATLSQNDSWRDELRKIYPEALQAEGPLQAADTSSGRPEQLLLIRLLDYMGTAGEKRIDNNKVRLTPLYYGTDGKKPLGVS